MSNSKGLYVTPKQKLFLAGRQKRKTFLGGRGTSKSVSIAFQDCIRLQEMPKARTFLAGPYFGQILTKTIPSYVDGLKMFGYTEYSKENPFGHYVLFKRPPESFARPWMETGDYSRTISFRNGYCKELISMYGADSGRGGSYDAGDIDESALCDKQDIDTVLVPSLRGNLYRIRSALHYQMCDYTSPAWLPSGQWVYDTEELAKEFPNEFLFIESCTADNAAISPVQIENMRRVLPRIVFEVEVEGKRLSKLPDSFYPTFNDKKHVVHDTTRHEFDEKTGLWVVTSNFLDTKQHLETSWDFNAAFTSLIVSQELYGEQRFDSQLFVKESSNKSMTLALAELFDKEYKDHKKKEVWVYGDRNGNSKSASNPLTHYEEIKMYLEKQGWAVRLMVEGLDSEHKIRHLSIADMLAETKENLPKIRINGNKAKYLIISIQQSPISPDYKKIKSSERSSIAQEKATHLSDCFDNILMAKFGKSFGMSFSGFVDMPFLVSR